MGAAVWYAATVKDAVIVAAAGNDSEDGCAKNPMFDPLDASDPRDWHQVKTVSSPSWFSDYVLSVGAVDNTGAPINKSLSGPWVGAAAPGVGIMGLSPETGGPVNAYPPSGRARRTCRSGAPAFRRPTSAGWPRWCGPSIPALTAHQIINRILQTAHNPPRGVDNQVGYGVVDPVAALTFNVPPGDRLPPGAQSRVITPAAAAAAGSPCPQHRASVFAGVVAAGVLVLAIAARRGGRDEARADRIQPEQRSRSSGYRRVPARVGELGSWADTSAPRSRWWSGVAAGVRPMAGSAGVVVGDVVAAGPATDQLGRADHRGQQPCRRRRPVARRRRGGRGAAARQGAPSQHCSPVRTVDVHRKRHRRRRTGAAAAAKPGPATRFDQRRHVRRRGAAASATTRGSMTR